MYVKSQKYLLFFRTKFGEIDLNDLLENCWKTIFSLGSMVSFNTIAIPT